jgi:hypothetical protein
MPPSAPDAASVVASTALFAVSVTVFVADSTAPLAASVALSMTGGALGSEPPSDCVLS